jgi:O-antigen/teichoic acid export membrane protein
MAVRSRAVDTLLTSVAQVAVLIGAALLGLLIAGRFGTSAQTDGFFTANAIYGLSLFVAQSLRTTTVARLVEGGPGFGALREHLGAVVVVFAGSVAVALLAVALAPLLGVSHDARATFQDSVLILCPAAGLQLLTGQAAAMLAALGDYLAASGAYVCGSLAAVAGFFVLTPGLGVEGVPVALTAGAAVTACVTAAGLVRRGWRPEAPRVDAGALRIAARLMLGAASLVAAQLVLTLSVAFAGATGEGHATLYSYAMMAVMLLTAALASPVSIVFAPVVAREWDRRPESLVALTLRAFRTGALLAGPAVAAVVLLGPGPGHTLLSSIADADVDRVFDLVLILAPSLLGTMLVMIPFVGLFAQGRFAELSAWSGVVVLVHAALSAAAVAAGGGLEAVAAVATASSLGLAAVGLVLLFGRGTGAVVAGAARALGAFVLPAAVAFAGAAAVVGFDRSLGRGAAAFALGAGGYALWLRARHPGEVAGLVAALRPRRPDASRS